MSEQVKTAHISDVTKHGDRTAAVRKHFGIEAFGVNAFTADAGGEVVNEHDEKGVFSAGQEELYVVTNGRARFTLAGQSHDAPAGTLVFARPDVRRSAVSEAPGTTVLAIGAPRGSAYEISPWESNPDFWPLYEAKDYDGASASLRGMLEMTPDSAPVLYNLACCESLAGRRDEALTHLRRAIELEPAVRTFAGEDGDFETLRGDAEFEELTKQADDQEEPQAPGDDGASVEDLSNVTAQAGNEDSTWIRIRKHFDVRAFGVNAYRGDAAGARVIEDHTEENLRHQELYFVLRGRARFTVGDEQIDAPEGTFVFLPDPEVRRGAHAEEPGTTVLATGGRPGTSFEVSPWEDLAEAWPYFKTKEYDKARDALRRGLEKHPDNPGGLYNLACCESLTGEHDAAIEHLTRAIERDGSFRELARGDEDFEPIRDDPRFVAAVAETEGKGPAAPAV